MLCVIGAVLNMSIGAFLHNEPVWGVIGLFWVAYLATIFIELTKKEANRC